MMQKKDFLETIYRMYVKDLYTYGMSCCFDMTIVEDAIHDIFLDIYCRREKLAKIGNLKHYLLSALRYGINFLRKDRHLFEEFDPDCDRLFGSDRQEWMDQEEKADKDQFVDKLLLQLNQHQREVIHLRFAEGLSFGEIAELMQMNRQSVQNLFGRAINKLRKKFNIK
ncbi:MAG: sigma-70 family RNA polymerase sigma factor [Tannerella sp.]|jgi:RNA polymerase sigma factor (sigma-70 family)|nr:sigma-70 family RNA polymerase sigma factor [Tannerella sp.]